MAELKRPSVQSLLLEMQFEGHSLAVGTGFVVESPKGPVLITNRHNVTGRDHNTNQPISPTGGVPDTITILHNRANNLGHWVSRTESLYNEYEPRWIEHPTFGRKVDFVALPLEQIDDVQFYPYNFSNINPTVIFGPADIVSVIGFPFGLQAGGSLAVWATGFIASEPSIDYTNLPVFLIDCRSRKGQSGSAVVFYQNGGMINSEDGHVLTSGVVSRLLGIYSGRVNEQSDLGMVWKKEAIEELVNSIK